MNILRSLHFRVHPSAQAQEFRVRGSQTRWLRRTGLLLMGVLLVMPARAPASESLDEATIETQYARYRQMDLANQRQWLEQLLQGRMLPAATVGRDSVETRRLRHRSDSVLKRFDAGSRYSHHTFAKLLQVIDQHERAAIERLARDYRIRVYQVFRSDRGVYERYIGAWQRVTFAWEDAGRPWAYQGQQISWLHSATKRLEGEPAALLGSTAQLPSIPTFAALPVASSRALEPALAETADSTQRPVAGLAAEPGFTASADPALVDRSAGHDAEGGTTQEDVAAEPVGKPNYVQAGPTKRGVSVSVGSDQPVVDLDEVAARVSSHNLRIARLSGAIQDQRYWSVERLADAVTELERLASRREHLRLYTALLKDADQIFVPVLATDRSVIALLSNKILAARQRLSGVTGAGKESVDEEQLDAVSRRFSALMSDGR